MTITLLFINVYILKTHLNSMIKIYAIKHNNALFTAITERCYRYHKKENSLKGPKS